MRKCRECKKSVNRSGLCKIHYVHKLILQKKRSQYRKLLGLCSRCTEPAESGKTCCSHHLKMSQKYTQKLRAKKAKLRGWKLMRVKV